MSRSGFDMRTPATVGAEDAAVGGMLGTAQTVAPEEQALISSINSTDSATLMTMEPRQPNRLEKKRNISGHRCLSVHASVIGSLAIDRLSINGASRMPGGAFSS